MTQHEIQSLLCRQSNNSRVVSVKSYRPAWNNTQVNFKHNRWLLSTEIKLNFHVIQNSVSFSVTVRTRFMPVMHTGAPQLPPNFQHCKAVCDLPPVYITKTHPAEEWDCLLNSVKEHLFTHKNHFKSSHSYWYCSGNAKPQANVSRSRVLTFRHDQCWKSRRCQRGADGVTLLSYVHSAVPASPSLGWGEHAASTTHLCIYS